MTIRRVFDPHRKRHLKLGRRRPVARGLRLRLKNYLLMGLPPPPATVDWSHAAAPVLANVYGNDMLGDCVIAAGYHIVGVETGNAGKLFTASDAQIVGDYSAIGGYVPGDESTDNGCDEETALNYWTHHGFANGSKALGWLAVDATNKTEVQAALWLFENLLFGIELPDAWIDPFPAKNGFIWDDGPPNPDNGHAVMGHGYVANGVVIDTWGMSGILTWKAIANLCTPSKGGELYVMLTPDQIAKGQAKAPNGFAWSTLIADFDVLGGNVPVPKPPPPGPAPAPAPAVTLAQAQQWASEGLAKNWPKAG